jgi:hypothetical protein
LPTLLAPKYSCLRSFVLYRQTGRREHALICTDPPTGIIK